MLKYLPLFIFLLSSAFISSQSKNGPVAKYTFDKGKIQDDVGKLHPVAYGVKLVEDRFGNAHSAIYFQGNPDSYLNLGTSNLLKPEKGTISLWVRVDQPIYKGQGLYCNPIIRTRSHIEDDFNEGYAIYYHFNIRKLHCNTSISELDQITLYPSETSYLRQWYHLVMTYDDKMLILYIDGLMEEKAAKLFKSKFLGGDSVLVGMQSGPKNKRFFQGSIDDIQIYNRVLSSKEILDLYNSPNPNKSTIIARWIFFCACIFMFVLLILLIIRWRINIALKAEKEKNQLKNNRYELENKVLTAQMDPHFIFNSLNTIQQFIVINDNEKAQLYLSKFSRLLRMILENNIRDSISLAEELEIVQKYLEIESIRFNNVFTYKFSVAEGTKPLEIRIPRFLIQPFVENAIWHGLLPKEGDKQLTISLEAIDAKTLMCIIEDNGIGREKAKNKEVLENKKSFAINFISQRLQLMSKIYKLNYTVTLTDKPGNQGTIVAITIPILNT